MSIWIPWIQPTGAKVTEVCVASRANHMVTAVSLLCRGVASWAGTRVQLEILQRSLVVLGKLAIFASGGALEELSMP